MNSKSDLEYMARTLDKSDDYKILRKVKSKKHFQENNSDGPLRCGLILDLETTGLNHLKDEIIEIALLPFLYGLDGTIYQTKKSYHSLQEPTCKIPTEITSITSITDEMTAGKKINISIVEEIIEASDIIVAHNASFDRPFAEKLTSVFKNKPWACSMTEINWASEGFEGAKLAYLLVEAGYFYEGHRAINDCEATLELLAKRLPQSGKTAFGQLLKNARKDTTRIWAVSAPFDKKELLKGRKYRWNSEASGSKPKAWFIDVAEDCIEDEMRFLNEEIFGRKTDLPVVKMSALDRFSERV